MHAHLGLAFCVESINYARFLINDQTITLDRIGSLSYPFAYNEAELFTDKYINALANLIKSKVFSEQKDFKNLSVSLESNLATLKRVAIPNNLDKEDENDLIAWDLKNSLIEPLDKYIYYKTPNCFKNENYTDYLTIAIRKDIIRSIKSLSELIELNLVDVSINQLNTEAILRNSLMDQTEGLIGVFKVVSSRLESTFLWNGDYYISHYDRLSQKEKKDLDKYDWSTKITSKVKQMENLFEQLFRKQVKIEQIYLYGDLIDDKFIDALQKNISAAVLRLDPLQNVEKSQQFMTALPALEEISKFVESIGVVLDQ
jgi:Tfp pilus assembly PilM family ATPase